MNIFLYEGETDTPSLFNRYDHTDQLIVPAISLSLKKYGIEKTKFETLERVLPSCFENSHTTYLESRSD